MRRINLLLVLLLLVGSVVSVAHADPALPLPRMPICGDQDGSEAPFSFRCPNFIPATDVQTYQVPGTSPIDLRFDFVFREATYNSELGYYLVDSASGNIGTLNPGDSGYISAAMQQAHIIFHSGSNAWTPDAAIHLNGGDILVFFIIQDSTLERFLANNPNNSLNRGPLAFFAINSLNPDAFDHLVGFTQANTIYTQFGFEDLTGGGDRDYDDIVYTITPALTPLTGQVALSPRRTQAQVAQPVTLVATLTSSKGVPLSDTSVTFNVQGVNVQTLTLTTDQAGMASFTYTSTQLGQDRIVASALIGQNTSSSNIAIVEWLAGPVGTLYITNSSSNEITVLNTADNTIAKTITIGEGAQGIAVNKAGTIAYSADSVSNQVSVIDILTGDRAATIPVGSGPVISALNHDERRLYVTNFLSDSVSIIDTTSNNSSNTLSGVSRPWGIAISPDDAVFAVSLYTNGQVAIFDAATLAPITEIAVGLNPEGLMFHPTAAKLYVANLGSSSISVIDTTTWEVSKTIDVGTQPGNNPVQLTLNDSASRLYVANDTSGTVTEIDTTTDAVLRNMPVGAGPRDVQVIGPYLYTTNTNDDTVSVIDLNSGVAVATIPGFHQPHSIGAFVAGPPTYIVSGEVIDHNGLFKQGVIISDDAAHTTTTDANGAYTLHGLLAGQHLITATYDGYTFLPGRVSERTLQVPDVNTLNFTAIIEPLIFIPGITGSWLDQDGGIPPCGIRNLWVGNLCSRLALNRDPHNIFRADNVIATDAIREITSFYPVYGPLLDQISAIGYREYQVDKKPERRTFSGCDTANQEQDHPNLFVYAYDWRLDNAENAALLSQYVTCIEQFYPNTRVNILTHSMGGLLARRYILDNPDKVDKLITIAAPWLGAPKAIMALETGAFLEPSFVQAVATQLSDAEIKTLVEFFPGAHQLLPSPAYFSLAGSPFGEQTYDSNGDKAITPNYSYEQFRILMNRLHQENVPGSISYIFHQYQVHARAQDDWSTEESNPQGVRYYHLYGVQDIPTTIGKLKAVNRQRCVPRAGCHTDKYDVDVTAGDGTVPVISATRSNDLTQSPGLNASGATLIGVGGPNKAVEHTALAKNQSVIDYVISILRPTIAQVAATYSQASAHALNHVDLTTATAQPAYYLRIDGIREMTIRDSNGNVASMDNDTLAGNIPNLGDIHLGDASHLLIMPADQIYTLVLHSGTEPIAIDFTIKTGDTPTVAVRYLDLVLPAGVNALLTLTPQTMEALRYDTNSDGSYETTVPPTAIATGFSASDTEPPVVAMQHAGTNAHTSVTLTATDTGSGVKEMFYSLDSVNFQPYSGAFFVNIGEVPTIYAFADDNVANRSGLFTFALADQSQPSLQLYLPITRR